MRGRFAAMMVLLLPGAAKAQCAVMATPVSFGVYQPFSAIPTDSIGSVTVRCRFFGPYFVTLNSGLTGNLADRRMSAAGFHLSYQLYTNPARRSIWGDGTGGSAIVFGFCAGSCSNEHPIYGRIPARQIAPPGTYADTITVTITF